MQKEEWTVKEFAKLTGYSPAYIRHCCNGYKNKRGQIAKLSNDYACKKRGRDWVIYQPEPNTNDLAETANNSPDKAATKRIEQLLNETIKSHPNPIEWLTDRLESCQFEQTVIDPRTGKTRTIRLRDIWWLYDVLEMSFQFAVSDDGNVKLQLLFKKTGDWGVDVIDTPNPLAYLDIRREGMSQVFERCFISAWIDEINNKKNKIRRTSLTVPAFKEVGIGNKGYKVISSLCLECGCKTNKQRNRIFCSDRCQDCHLKWVSNRAQTCNSSREIFEAANQRMDKAFRERLQKIEFSTYSQV